MKSVDKKSNAQQHVEFVYYGRPVPKPRMVRSDRWRGRPEVLRYFEFKEAFGLDARRAGIDGVTAVLELDIRAYIAMPKSWSQKKRSEMAGRVHMQKPDTSNIIKAVEDALTSDDSSIYRVMGEKLWDDGYGERLEIRAKIVPASGGKRQIYER